VFGLLTVWANCGMTLEPYHVTRVNLRDLAAATHPECVDASAIDAEEFALLKESHSRSYRNPRRLCSYPMLSDLKHWHDAFERAARGPEITQR
jgi:hypothetical protein